MSSFIGQILGNMIGNTGKTPGGLASGGVATAADQFRQGRGATRQGR
jgi:hypothetical protein